MSNTFQDIVSNIVWDAQTLEQP